jgi:hypothetical protein
MRAVKVEIAGSMLSQLRTLQVADVMINHIIEQQDKVLVELFTIMGVPCHWCSSDVAAEHLEAGEEYRLALYMASNERDNTSNLRAIYNHSRFAFFEKEARSEDNQAEFDAAIRTYLAMEDSGEKFSLIAKPLIALKKGRIDKPSCSS